LQYDVLITVGGVSMGAHDYVRPCLAEIEAEEVFWKINQQPGGPMLYAIAGGTQIFGLPGNPVSSYVCADIYVQAALRRRAGVAVCDPVAVDATLRDGLKKPHGKVAFVRCSLSTEKGVLYATSTGAQDSNRIRSIACHSGYIVFPEDKRELSAGESVQVLVTDAQQLLHAYGREAE
jgi:molybdopterin molybdotransferase